MKSVLSLARTGACTLAVVLAVTSCADGGGSSGASASASSTAKPPASAPKPSGSVRESAPAVSGAAPTASGAPSVTPSSSGGPASGTGSQRPIGAFTRLRVATSLAAEIEIGAASPLELTGDPAVLADVETRLEGDTLVIELKAGSHDLKGGVKIRASVPKLVSVSAATAGTISVKGLACDDLSAEAATSAKVTLIGTCKKLDAKAATAATIDAKGLEAQTVSVDAATGSTIAVNAKDAVTGTAATGAKVQISGSPKTRKVETATGATVD